MNKNLRTALLSGAATLALAAFERPAQAQVDGFRAILQGQYQWFSGADITYAEDAGPTPGRSFSEEVDRGWAGKAGVGVRFGGKWDANLIYTGIRSKSARGSAVATGSSLYPVLGASTSFYSSATVRTELRGDLVDLEIGHTMGLGGGTLRLLGGLRYGRFTQDTKTNFSFDGGEGISTLNENRKSRFTGLGPRLGAEANLPLGGGLSLIGGANVSFLFGRQDARTSQVFSANTSGNNTATRRANGTAIGLEGELGLGYAIAPAINLAVGVNATAWSDIFDTSNLSSQFGARYGSQTDGFFAIGPFARIVINM